MDTSRVHQNSPLSRPVESHSAAVAAVGLNVGAAIFFAGFFYVSRNWTLDKATNDSTYLSFRAMLRVIDFLGLQSHSPVTTKTLRREFLTRSELLGAEAFMLLTWLGVAAATTLVLLSLRYTRTYQFIERRTTWRVLLFAGPACFLGALWLTRSWPVEPGAWGTFASRNASLFGTEVLCAWALFILTSGRNIPPWVRIVGIALHLVFWMTVLWLATSIPIFPIYSRAVIMPSLPASMLMYVRYEHQQLPRTTQMRTIRWTLATAPLVVLAAGLAWRPARNVELNSPRDLSSATIELSRGPCYGSCAVYTVTVHGDGSIEYVGRQRDRDPRIQTIKSGTIEKEKVAKILGVLDNIGFMVLDDRAFFCAFDTPSVGVRVSVGEKMKQVSSDAVFFGAPHGRQARFVQATDQIEEILASATWVSCRGDCENPPAHP